MAKVSNLKILLLDGTDVDDELGTQLAASKSLMRLELSRTKVTGRGLEKLAVLGLRLELQESALSDEGLRSLGLLPGLCWLNISKTKVSPAGLRHLQALPILSRVIMEGHHFGDDHLEAIAGCVNLSELDLRETRVTSKGVRLVERLTELRTLSVEGAVLNDPQAVESLRRCSNLMFLTARVNPGQPFNDDQMRQSLGPRIRLFVTEEAGQFPQERVLRREF